QLFIPLVGEHQIMNSLSVVETARALNKRGYHITEMQIKEGISTTRFPGRMETVRENPLCIVDGAHNRDGVTVLAREIDRLLKNKRLITVMGMLRDKDYTFCIPQIASRSAVFIAVSPNNPRALDAEVAAEHANKVCKKVIAMESIEKAVETAISLSKNNDDVILVCGSLYMLGSAKKTLMEE
ncbi:MAG: hypothetical protein N2Z65_08285, partial [Clostridiales bacterium]|nr:hypothetical protein [Clostridiales bacterium]